jgi:hypothetical protein
MSLEDFQQMGLLREEHSWGREKSRVSRIGMVIAMVISLLGCAIMIIGDGDWRTGAGIALFIVGLFVLIVINLHGVKQPGNR